MRGNFTASITACFMYWPIFIQTQHLYNNNDCCETEEKTSLASLR